MRREKKKEKGGGRVLLSETDLPVLPPFGLEELFPKKRERCSWGIVVRKEEGEFHISYEKDEGGEGILIPSRETYLYIGNHV